MAIAVDQNYDKAQRKISTANLEQFAGVDCQLLVEKETHRPIIMDGVTVGGKFKCASTDELEAVKAKADSAVSFIEQSLTTEQKAQVVQNLEGTFLPLGGGTMTGTIKAKEPNILSSPTNDQYVNVNGGQGYGQGASVTVYGKDHSATPGVFAIVAKDDTNEQLLVGWPDGRLSWAGKSIEHVNAIGENYIRYESGLQICWGETFVPGGQINTTVTLPVPYKDISYTTNASYLDVEHTTVGATTANSSGTDFRVAVTDLTGNYSWDRYFAWSTIGRWK